MRCSDKLSVGLLETVFCLAVDSTDADHGISLTTSASTTLQNGRLLQAYLRKITTYNAHPVELVQEEVSRTSAYELGRDG